MCPLLTCHFHSAESRQAEQLRANARAHRQASSTSLLILRRPDRALFPVSAAAKPGSGPSRGQQCPGPRPELRRQPGQRRSPADGHHPGGHQQRLSSGRGRFHNRRSLLVGYEILLRGSDRTEPVNQGPAPPHEAGPH